MARIASILHAVAGGAGHLAFLAGEPASGKTRLLQELTLEARKLGFVVLTGGCLPADLNSPYHPLLEAFEPLISSSAVALDSEVQNGWKAIGQLAAANGTDRQVAAAVANALVQASNSSPVALLLDDLQWADRETLSVLHGVARATRATRTLLAAAFTDVELAKNNRALATTLQSLGRDRLAEYLTVRRLSLEETAELVAALMGQSDVSEEFASFVYRRTKGSPRFIDELIRSLGGRLDLEGEIGAGSTGRVFRAYDRVTARTVAAKLVLARAGIDLDALLRFQQEGAILRSLDHPNIVRIYDSFVDEHVGCIVMELLEGRSLATVLADGPLGLPRAKSIGAQTAGALAFAHSQSVVHRDVKPDNVMILDDDVVKVTDFGIARILSVDTLIGTVATTGMRAGTPLYMAPEQIEGKKVDARSDVYALGATLYHMVSGRPPFDGNDALEIAVKQIKEQPAPPSSVRPGIPSHWDALILKSLAKEPRRRFQSMEDMKRGIDSLGTDMVRAPARVARTRALRPVSAIILIVALIGSAFVYTNMTGQAKAATLSSYLANQAAGGKLSGTVLVAAPGKVLLEQGYGMANHNTHAVNTPNTQYALADATSISLLAAAELQLTQRYKVAEWYPNPYSPMCPDVPIFPRGCPPKWGKKLTSTQATELANGSVPPGISSVSLARLIRGTSLLPDYRWQHPGATLAKTEAACGSLPLQTDPKRVQYTSCATLVMGLFNLPTGFIPNGKNTFGNYNLVNVIMPKRQLAQQLRDNMHSRRLALDYDLSDKVAGHDYDAYYVLQSTARKLYRYDNLVFSGTYMLPPQTHALLNPRGIPAPPDPGIHNVQWADGWKTGILFGSHIDYTYGNMYDYKTVNLRFRQSGLTVIVMSNTASTNALNIAEHAASFALKTKLPHITAPRPAPSRPKPAPTTAPLRSPHPGTLISLHGRGNTFNLTLASEKWKNVQNAFVAPTRFQVHLKYVCATNSETLFSVQTNTRPPRNVIIGDSIAPGTKHPQHLRANTTKIITSTAVERWGFWMDGGAPCTWSFKARAL